MGENEKRKKITIYVYNKKQLAQAQSMWGYFCLAYQKKKIYIKNKLQIAFYPSQIHDSADYYSQTSTIAMLPPFFRIITLDGELRRECRRGVHIPGGMRFPCQPNHQLQRTRCRFAEE